MNNMRDEFEIAWAESRCDDDGIIGNKPTRSLVNSDCYAGGAAQSAWVWWKRSRAALRVGLPSMTNNGYEGFYSESSVISALKSAGVRYE